MNRLQTNLQLLQKKISREKRQYSMLLDKLEKLQSSQSTDKSSQLPLDTSQQEDHDKSEELQTSTRSLDEDTITELTKLESKMEDVSVSLEKVNTVKKYWEQVHAYLLLIIAIYKLVTVCRIMSAHWTISGQLHQLSGHNLICLEIVAECILG